MKKLFILIIPMCFYICVFGQGVKSILRSEKIYLVPQKESYQPGDTINISGCVVEAQTLKPHPYSNYLQIELMNRTDSVLIRQKVKCADGVFSARIPLDYILKDDIYYIRVYTSLMRNYPDEAFYLRPVQVGKAISQSTLSGNYKVRFFPEGGNVVAGKVQNIVFEVKDEANKPVLVEAYLTNEQGDTIKTVRTTATSGLGLISFCMESNTNYLLKMTSAKGSVSFPLPPAGDLPSLQVYVNRNVVGYRVLSEKDLPVNTYRLLVFYRGICCKDTFLTDSCFAGKIDLKDFPAGLVAFVLADADRKPVSERLIFLSGNNPAVNLEIKNEKEIYAPGETFAYELNYSDSIAYAVWRLLPASDTTPLLGKTDIRAELFLTSDVTRPVHDAALLFNSPDQEIVYDSERFLYTCNWKRFSWEEALKDSFQYAYLPEEVLSLSGKILKENGKVLTKGSIVAINNENGFTYDMPLKEDGSFILGVDDYVEGTTFFMQGYNEKGKSIGLTVVPNSNSYPPVVNPLKSLLLRSDDEERQFVDTHTSYSFDGRFDYYYDENKSKTYRIPEIQVSARVKRKQLPTKEFYRHNFIGDDILKESPYSDIIPYFIRLTGVQLKTICKDDMEGASENTHGGGGSVSVSASGEDCRYVLTTTRGNPGLSPESDEVPVLLDGILVDTDYTLRTLDPHQVESIERLTTSQAMRYTSFAFNGVISIKTRGYKELPFVSQGIHYTPIGLNNEGLTSEFRFIPCRQGEVKTIQLPSAVGSYQLVVEGITSEGTPFSFRSNLTVK